MSLAAAAVLTLTADVPVSGQDNERAYTESYVLMEASTGTVVRQRDGDRRVSAAGTNKLMTVLLAAEAVEKGQLSLDESITVQDGDNPGSGAQIWLEAGDRITVTELLKSVIIGNAGDACRVLARRVAGSEEAFVRLMNTRAQELSMTDSYFTESTGYFDSGSQYTTAYDAAKLLRELAGHSELTDIFTTRLDSVKGGTVQLVTTNRLSHTYKGSVGFKCGTAPDCGYFAAEGAVRDGVTFVCAVMDCGEEDTALALARELLDIAFSGYVLADPPFPDEMPDVLPVKQGTMPQVRLSAEPVGTLVVPKGSEDRVKAEIYLPDYVYAPLERGDKIGEIKYFLGDRSLKVCRINAAEKIPLKNFKNVLLFLMKKIVSF